MNPVCTRQTPAELTARLLEWAATIEPREEPEAPTTRFKCPKCGAHAFDLWLYAGLSFLKCDVCAYKQDTRFA